MLGTAALYILHQYVQ